MLKPVFFAANLIFATNTAATQVEARSWYPPQCKIDYCWPVQNAELTPTRSGAATKLVISANGRTAIIQHLFNLQRSKDEQFHVCMRYDPFGDLEVTCLMVPSRGLAKP